MLIMVYIFRVKDVDHGLYFQVIKMLIMVYIFR